MIAMPKDDLPIMQNIFTHETKLIDEIATLDEKICKDGQQELSSLKKKSSASALQAESSSYNDSDKDQPRKRRRRSSCTLPENYLLNNHLKVLENLTRDHGPSHARVGKQLNAIGLYYQHVERDLQKAIKYHQMAMDVQRNTEDSVATLIDLAFVWEQQGNYLRAIDQYSKAKKVLENVCTVQEFDHRLYAIRSGLARSQRDQH